MKENQPNQTPVKQENVHKGKNASSERPHPLNNPDYIPPREFRPSLKGLARLGAATFIVVEGAQGLHAGEQKVDEFARKALNKDMATVLTQTNPQPTPIPTEMMTSAETSEVTIEPMEIDEALVSQIETTLGIDIRAEVPDISGSRIMVNEEEYQLLTYTDSRDGDERAVMRVGEDWNQLFKYKVEGADGKTYVAWYRDADPDQTGVDLEPVFFWADMTEEEWNNLSDGERVIFFVDSQGNLQRILVPAQQTASDFIRAKARGEASTISATLNPLVLEAVPEAIQSQYLASFRFGGRYERVVGDETQLWSSRLGESQPENLEAGWTRVLDTVSTTNMGTITSEALVSENWDQRPFPAVFGGFTDEAINQGLIENGIRQFWVETLTGIGGSTLEYVTWDHVLSVEEAEAMLDDTENWPAIIVPIQVVDDYYHPRVDKARSIDAYDEAHPEDPASHIDYIDIRQGISVIHHSAVSRVQMQGEQQPDRSWMTLLTSYDAGGSVAEPAMATGASVTPDGRLEIHLFGVGGIRNYDQNFVAYVPYYFGDHFVITLNEIASQTNLSPHILPEVDARRFTSKFWSISNAFGLGANLQESNQAWTDFTLPSLFDIHD